jgi:uncharacterized protein YcnI
MGLLKPLAAALALAATPALAHIAADPGEASAGAYQAVRFRVGHGCGDSEATTAVRIEIPEAIVSARPQPKPGWRLEIAKDGEKVSAVTWRGELPADQFDEFALFFKLPAEAQTLAFPAVQTCDADEAQWTELPGPGPRGAHPAPTLVLKPAAAPAEAHHH